MEQYIAIFKTPALVTSTCGLQEASLIPKAPSECLKQKQQTSYNNTYIKFNTEVYVPRARIHSLFPFLPAIANRVSKKLKVCTGDSYVRTQKVRQHHHQLFYSCFLLPSIAAVGSTCIRNVRAAILSLRVPAESNVFSHRTSLELLFFALTGTSRKGQNYN